MPCRASRAGAAAVALRRSGPGFANDTVCQRGSGFLSQHVQDHIIEHVLPAAASGWPPEIRISVTPLPRLTEIAPLQPDRRQRHANLGRDLRVRRALRRTQHNPRAHRLLLRRRWGGAPIDYGLTGSVALPSCKRRVAGAGALYVRHSDPSYAPTVGAQRRRSAGIVPAERLSVLVAPCLVARRGVFGSEKFGAGARISFAWTNLGAAGCVLIDTRAQRRLEGMGGVKVGGELSPCSCRWGARERTTPGVMGPIPGRPSVH